jgi:DNA polymerase
LLGFYDDPRPIKKVDKDLRQRMKPIRLGGEYGQGASGLIEYAKGYKVTFSASEAEHLVALFRERYTAIKAQWRKLDIALRNAAGRGDLVLNLPSGNTLTYRNVRYKVEHGKSDIVAEMVKGSRPIESRLWGSRIHENCCQAVARDVLCQYLLDLDDAGFDVRLSVHDEAVALLPIEGAEERLEQMIKIMSTPPPWMPSLPAGAEGFLTKEYRKG